MPRVRDVQHPDRAEDLLLAGPGAVAAVEQTVRCAHGAQRFELSGGRVSREVVVELGEHRLDRSAVAWLLADGPEPFDPDGPQGQYAASVRHDDLQVGV